MAKKITALNETTTISDEDLIPIVQNNETKIVSLVNMIYPVGSIYMSVNNTSPATLFGGTWEKIEGRYLLGAGTPTQNSNTNFGTLSNEQLSWVFNNGDTLGQYQHTLTENELPSHRHAGIFWGTADTEAISLNSGTASGYSISYNTGILDSTRTTIKSGATGQNVAHNIVPPSLVVNIWKRTA